jgi:hypothetical protein
LLHGSKNGETSLGQAPFSNFYNDYVLDRHAGFLPSCTNIAQTVFFAGIAKNYLSASSGEGCCIAGACLPF